MSREIGIDLGTANVLIHLNGRGVIINEPSVVAVDTETNEIIAYGKEAYQMIGRTPDRIQVIYPLDGGVISDYELAEAMLILFIQQFQTSPFFIKPTILICTPTQVNDIEKRSLLEVAEKAGKGRVYIEEETKVAALGAGADILSPNGLMIIDIGGGTSDISIIASGEIVNGMSLKIAGDKFNQAIIDYVKETKQFLIGPLTAEEVKIAIGSAIHQVGEGLLHYEVKGIDLISRLPGSIQLNSNDIAKALNEPLLQIARTLSDILKETKDNMMASINEEGILLTGGGANLSGLDDYLSNYLNVNVIVVSEPMKSVAMGTNKMLEYIREGKWPLNKDQKQASKFSSFKKILNYWLRRFLG